MRATIAVPATSANLGPGFDVFGLALGLVNEVTLDTDAPAGVRWRGEGAASLPTDGSDLLSTTIARVAAGMVCPLRGLGSRPATRFRSRAGWGRPRR